MTKELVAPTQISSKELFMRKVTLTVGQRIQPFEREAPIYGWLNLEDPHGGFKKAEEAARYENAGSLWIVVHPSLAEMQRAAGIALKSNVYKRRPILIPMAIHQQKRRLDQIGKLTNISFPKLYIPDTDKYIENSEKQAKYPEKIAYLKKLQKDTAAQKRMFAEYREKALYTLQQGGLVIAPSTAGRQPYIDHIDPVAGLLVADSDHIVEICDGQKQRTSFDNWTISTLTFDINGVTSYNTPEVADNYQLFKNIVFRFGPTYWKQELKDKARARTDEQKTPGIKAKPVRVDEILLEDIMRMSSPAHFKR